MKTYTQEEAYFYARGYADSHILGYRNSSRFWHPDNINAYNKGYDRGDYDALYNNTYSKHAVSAS